MKSIALALALGLSPPMSLPAESLIVSPVQQACCKVCTNGKACGNSCIALSKTCRKPPGCACQG